MSAPELRPLGVDDLDAVTQLEVAAQPLPWSEDQLLLELVHDDARVIGAFVVAEGARALSGYVAVRRLLEEAWVLNIAVHPERRRAGLGRALLDAACAQGRAWGCTSLWLEVREGNAAARALYHAYGLTERGRRPGYYPPIPPAAARETAVLLSRVI